MYIIHKYEKSDKEIWDSFVIDKSINGTFLQTKQFLSYHPEDRFVDDSIMIYDDKKLIAVVPGCIIRDEKSSVYYSHKGTSYGGPIISSNYYHSEQVVVIIRTIDEYLREEFDKAIFKITPDLFTKEKSDLLQYAFQYCGYSNYTELSTYVDLDNIHDDICSSFDRNKKRNIRKCIELGLEFRELQSDEEIVTFHKLLSINLGKFGAKPIHSVSELFNLKHNIAPGSIKFFGAFLDKDIVAAGMMFDFDGVVFHAQNLSYDYRDNEYSPITFLYYKVIEYAKCNGYKYLSWGISTEDCGRKLNFGLIRNKESYGSKYQVNRTFYKNFEDEL